MDAPPAPPPLSPEPPAAQGAQRRARRDDAWVVGVILIALGVFFLLQNLNVLSLRNWWALFILIPAFGALRDGWRHYQQDGSLSSRARNAFFIGFLLILVSVTFLLSLSWTWLGPILIILFGLNLLLNAL